MTVDVSPKPEMPEEYLGDAVYASFDGYYIWLRSADGRQQQIALEDVVFQRLMVYAQKVEDHYGVKGRFTGIR